MLFGSTFTEAHLVMQTLLALAVELTSEKMQCRHSISRRNSGVALGDCAVWLSAQPR